MMPGTLVHVSRTWSDAFDSCIGIFLGLYRNESPRYCILLIDGEICHTGLTAHWFEEIAS